MYQQKRLLSPTGSVLSWIDSHGKPVLFEHTEIGGKVRGDNHVCCPNFGTAPFRLADYAHVSPEELPQHGLMRLPERGELLTDNFTAEQGAHLISRTFERPWRHSVQVSVRFSPDHLFHQLSVWRERDVDGLMPVSLGFHPYFATNDEDFTVYVDNASGRECGIDTFPHNEAQRRTGKVARIEFTSGRTVIIKSHESYDAFCIWTDDIRQYICVEPILGGFGCYKMLEPGGTINCAVTIDVQYL